MLGRGRRWRQQWWDSSPPARDSAVGLGGIVLEEGEGRGEGRRETISGEIVVDFESNSSEI